jgi:superfamily II DNA/RNA helicase
LEERSDIERLLGIFRHLPPDSKLEHLRNTISDLRTAGYGQVMVFTQFTDTMDFLCEQVGLGTGLRIMCFSGRGGEIMSIDGSWRTTPRDDVKRRFRDGNADILLCTEAAAEGLNFQFCGSLINYDMPWNPMRVEQRIGRIDRLGQRYPEIRIVNLHYADTIEADVYAALRQRIGLFENVVGRLQPILARLPTLISGRVLEGRTKTRDDRQATVNEVEIEAARANQSGFDIDAVTDADLTEPLQAASPMTTADLDRVLTSTTLLPPGIEVSPMGAREYRFQQPGLGRTIRISTDAVYYEENADKSNYGHRAIRPSLPLATIQSAMSV